jgi:peptidoglycan/LPS O-acetylase OafA/YrhL
MPALSVSVPAPIHGRVPILDELKGLAIALIIAYHAGGVLVWNNYLHGDAGVDMFLILSGVGLVLGGKEETAASFFKRRLVRLMPTYWVVLTVYLLSNTHFLQLHYSGLNIVSHYAGLHVLFGEGIGLAINDSFWFVTTILGLYVGYWALRPLLGRVDRFVFWTGLIGAAVALTLFFANQPGLMGHVGFRVPAFFLGMLVGQVLKTGRIDIPLTPWLGAGFFLLFYVPYTRGITFYSSLVAAGLIALYLWTYGARASEAGRSRRALSFLGRHSLEIFLLHQPLMREYNYYLHGRWFNEPTPSPLSLTAGMALALAVTLMLSVELHRIQRLVSKV